MYDTGVPHLVSLVEDLGEYDKALASKMRYEHNANVNLFIRWKSFTCKNL